MDLRLVEALIVLLQAAAVALGIWNKSRIDKVRVEMNGKLHQLMTAEKSVSYTEGREEGRTEGQPPTKFPGV